MVAASLEANLNLEKIAENPEASYKPHKFPAVILHFEHPYRATILVFASGKIIITGLTSSNQIKPILNHVEKFLKEINDKPNL